MTSNIGQDAGRHRPAPLSRAKRTIRSGVAATLLLSCSPLALHAEVSNAELAKEIAELKAQIHALKGAVSATRVETRREVQKVKAVAREPYVVAPGTAPLAIPAGATPVFATADKKMIFGDITITPGGFIEGAGIFRSRSTQSDVSSNFIVPFPNNSLSRTNEAHFSARDSRFAVLAEAPITPTFIAAAYAEIDFNAAAPTANQNQTNSFQPRIRNMYATLDYSDYGMHVLAGQNWSLLTLNSKGITPRNEVTPAVIDSSQHVGSLYARQPGIRLTKDFDKKLWISIAAEQSATTGCPAPAAFGTTNGVQVLGGGTITATCGAVGSGGSYVGAASAGPEFSLNHIPDIIGKVAYEARLADRDVHIEAEGVYTDLYDRVQTGAAFGNKETTGYGVGGGLIVPVIPKTLDFQINGLYGRGINRYGPASLPDATFNSDGSLRPIEGYIAMTGLTFHATPAIDIFSYAGIEGEKRTYTPTGVGAAFVGLGAPGLNNTGCFTEGSANCTAGTHRIYELTVGFWDKIYKGTYGEVRAGATYSYLNREIFSSPGVANVATNDHIVYTSLRYYPFQ